MALAAAFHATCCLLGTVPGGRVGVVEIAPDGLVGEQQDFSRDELSGFVREREESCPQEDRGQLRWVWSDTAHWLPALLDDGVRVRTCYDLRLSHAILRDAQLVADRSGLLAADEWNRGSEGTGETVPPAAALFDIDDDEPATVPHALAAALEEFARHEVALGLRVSATSSLSQENSLVNGPEEVSPANGDASPHTSSFGRLRLLLAAESAGALIAAEMRAAGIPWDVEEHDRILRESLGPRPPLGGRPAKMAHLAQTIEELLDAPGLSIDSPPKLLRALQRAGIDARSTSKWELKKYDHPAIEPLLQYKKMSRLLTANGWSWIDEWVRDGRYHPIYVPGGVVTGRWAANGGGVLQIPRQLRPAIRADPGWTLVSADVSQLEPRVLAAMSGDEGLAAAGRGRDLYAGIVESGIVDTRDEAKYAMLGAMYGSTTGDSARLLPRLRQAYPRAMRMVDDAATAGTRGGTVSTWLGRTSPAPSSSWMASQSHAQSSDATAADEDRARRVARDFGRFTRNFIVQGTAAEWALIWLARIRSHLAQFPPAPANATAATGPAFEKRAHLVFFLHDEVIVHAPLEQAEAAAAAITAAASEAGRILFGQSPVDFLLDTKIGETAKK
ncbi:MAG: bifunctional 3'-5' exonuclease/DNA polymerase [Ancrocorticia sp.]